MLGSNWRTCHLFEIFPSSTSLALKSLNFTFQSVFRAPALSSHLLYVAILCSNNRAEIALVITVLEISCSTRISSSLSASLP